MNSTLHFPLSILVLIGTMLWIDVPFVPQEEQGCGAASIAMVMQYWRTKGHDVSSSAMDQEKIMALLHSNDNNGIQATDVASYFQQNGFKAFAFSGSLKDIKHHVERGRPLIAALEAKGRSGKFHYLVIAGFDPGGQLVLVNDPAERKLLKMTEKDFEKRWEATGKWTLLAVPKQ